MWIFQRTSVEVQGRSPAGALRATMQRQLGAPFALMLALCALLAAPSGAAAALSGSIAGTVKEAGLTKNGIVGLCVDVYPTAGGRYEGVVEVTGAGGEYKVEDLAAGAYYVAFYKCYEGFTSLKGAKGNSSLNFVERYYNATASGTPESSKAAQVRIESGKLEATGIGAEMKEGGVIRGSLLNAKGQYMSGVCVVAFSEAEEAFFTTSAGTEGVYEFTGLPTGAYVVEYFGCGQGDIVSSYYDEAESAKPDYRTSSYTSATRLQVKAEVEPEPATRLALREVRLETGGVIEGAIADSEGHVVTAPMCIEAVSTAGGAGGYASTVTGHYVIEGLSSGSYDLSIEECHEEGKATTWASQYYNGASSRVGATPVSVTAGLEPPVPATADFKLVRSSAIKPVSTAAPAISGTAVVNQTLSCSTGAWTGSPPPTYSYQWLRDGAAVAGATSATYVVEAADQGHSLACMVTATNEAGSASETSATVAVPIPPPPAKKEEPAPPKSGTALVVGNGLVQNGKAALALKCIGEGACKGTLKLVAKIVVKIHKHGKVKRKTRTVTIGKATFSIVAGGKETIKVPLTGKGKALVAKAGKHGLSVALTGTDVKSQKVLLKMSNRGHSRPARHKGKH